MASELSALGRITRSSLPKSFEDCAYLLRFLQDHKAEDFKSKLQLELKKLHNPNLQQGLQLLMEIADARGKTSQESLVFDLLAWGMRSCCDLKSSIFDKVKKVPFWLRALWGVSKADLEHIRMLDQSLQRLSTAT